MGAGLLLDFAIRETGLSNQATEFSHTENGKPYIPGFPLHFNLSHSGEFALCAVSTVPVGCDIEKLRANANFGKELSKRFFTSEEADYIDAIENESEKSAAFFRIWTQKESYVKAIGKGIAALPFNTFSVLDSFPSGTSAAEFGEIEGYACCACVLAENAKFSFSEIDLTKILSENN